MTKQQNTTRRINTETGNRPPHRVFAVTEPRHEGGKSFWQDIGAAWAHEEGQGLQVVLNYLPLQGQNIVKLLDASPECPLRFAGAGAFFVPCRANGALMGAVYR